MTVRATKAESRQLGEARLEVAHASKSPDDWKRLWKKPANDWCIKWGSCWKQCLEYAVPDFASEVGFFIDVLGFPTNAFGHDYAMFTSPDKDFFFAVVPARGDRKATVPDTIRLQFMVEDIYDTALELEKRGIVFDKRPASYNGSPIHSATLHTPNGIPVDLWGMVDPKTSVKRRIDSTAPKVKAKA